MTAGAQDEPSPWDLPVSVVPGVHWPALVHPRAAPLLALLFQLERSQWWSPEALRRRQLMQVQALLRHARQHVPHYRRTLERGAAPPGPLSWEDWQELPILTRAELQAAGTTLDSPAVPKSHGRVRELRSSGSTGRPVAVRKTELGALFYQAFSLRDHIWHRRDPTGKHAAIRHSPGTPPQGTTTAGWGSATRGLYATGPSAKLHSATDVDSQAAWLLQEGPEYLLAYPSIIEALAEWFLERGASVPGLRQVRSFGEALGPATRDLARRAWGVTVVDTYSAQEIGQIALQCPQCEHYHVVAEGVLVEVVDERNRPCGPGEIGRVLVTPLHNLATPLIRYEIGDHAEVGQACPCGRGLPVLTRIIGRSRNLVQLPDGRRYRPAVGINEYAQVAPLRQAQLVQRTLRDVEARIVVREPLSPAQEQRLVALIQESLGHPFNVELTYVDEVSRSASGKFEDFLCLVAPSSGAGEVG